MHRLKQHFWPTCLLLTILLAHLSDALPRPPQTAPQPSRPKNIKRTLLLPRTDEPFLGPEWDIVTMENHAAYLPHASAAAALTSFYTGLQSVALGSLVQPDHHFVYRINRVLITFHARGITVPMELVLRFALNMLGFTRMGYTCAYRMQFRHAELGFVLTVTLTVDEAPPEQGECALVEQEHHGEVNQSGIRQVCIIRPPSLPGPGS
ncbi:MAG: hypothetical protein Q9170_002612 [Blastenia crenularia]